MKRKREGGQSTLLDHGFSKPEFTERPPIEKKSVQMSLFGTRMRNVTLGVVGSRSMLHHEQGFRAIHRAISLLAAQHCHVTKIVSGGADGADKCAEAFCKKYEMAFEPFLPGPEPSPERYFLRNKRIVDNSDFLLALWDGKTRGTRNTLKHAASKPIPIYVWTNWNSTEVSPWEPPARNRRKKKPKNDE